MEKINRDTLCGLSTCYVHMYFNVQEAGMRKETGQEGKTFWLTQINEMLFYIGDESCS